jgi:hypothetical protein
MPAIAFLEDLKVTQDGGLSLCAMPARRRLNSLPQEGAVRHALCGMLVLIGAGEWTPEKIER